jgi:hypothetical protein
MMMSLPFEPHSWYKGFAIQDMNRASTPDELEDRDGYRWHAFAGDGRTYLIVEVKAGTLRELKQRIREYRRKYGR